MHDLTAISNLTLILYCLCLLSTASAFLSTPTRARQPLLSSFIGVGTERLRKNVNGHGKAAIVRMMNLQLSPLAQDLAASTLSVAGTIAWLQIWITLAKRNIIPSNLSRKIIHTGSAPLFMCLWPLFSTTPQARFFASGVVALQMTRLILAGTLKAKNEEVSDLGAGNSAAVSEGLLASSSNELVNAISRTGANTEALGGPLVYTIILLICTALFFRESPIGIVAVIQMAAGDGMADIVGRRFGKDKWFFSEKKSYAGSAAFVLSAFTVTCGIMALYHATGFLGVDVAAQWPTVLLISVLCALVEVLPLGEDNVSVPIAGAVLASALL